VPVDVTYNVEREKLLNLRFHDSRNLRSVFNSAAIGLLLACVFALLPGKAFAHAVLVSSYPSANATVIGPNIDIVLKYNSRVDPSNSMISVLGPDGKLRQVVPERQYAPNDLAAHAGNLAPGAYMLRWQALSSDGHITRGEFSFHVK
jgi:copper resistance protein C